MTIKTGSIVSHAGALQWGAGKVLEVTATKVTIQFSDGMKRKVAASHFSTLQPADAALYVPPAAAPPVVLAARKARKTK
jgi:uncharacterized protein DUF3553